MVRLRSTTLRNKIENNCHDTLDWLESITKKYSIKNPELVKRALELSRIAGAEKYTAYNTTCLHQGLNMAEILCPLKVDDDTLVAAIIYSCVRYAEISPEDVQEYFGETIYKIIQNAIQLDSIAELSKMAELQNEGRPAKIDNLRKMLLAMVNDIRSVLIKLAEHLYVLRNITKQGTVLQKQIATETSAIYAPLANRLGIGSIKWEMEDLAFRYTDTEKYKQISKALNQRRIEREQYVENFIQTLQKTLEVVAIKNFQITGRVKHIFSIYRKMQKKNADIEKIYDITAVRIIVPTVEDCYRVLSYIHSKWKYIQREFDDYITTPKPNGYQSIHTVVIGPEGRNIEVQIRTYQMHQAAELGNAAHWVYKEGPQQSDYEAKIAWLREIMDWQKQVAPAKNIQQVFKDRVYVFTPSSEIIDLIQGSTPLDFAYHIHSQIGHRCRGAKINGKMVPLTSQLKTGDRVEIITVKNPQPSRDWLNPNLGFLKTSRARTKVQQWFKEQDHERHLNDGREFLEKELRRLNLKNININDLAASFDFKTANDFFASIGSGELKVGSIINLIQRKQNALKKSVEKFIKPAKKKATKETDIKILGIGNILTNIANCCKPTPKTPIIGYVRQGHGVTIHKKDCFNIIRAHSLNPEKLVAVYWGGQDTVEKINLVIEAHDRHGLIKDITTVLAHSNIAISGLTCNVNRDLLARIELVVEVETPEVLKPVFTKLKALKNVINIISIAK